jgi:hypothetical protein
MARPHQVQPIIERPDRRETSNRVAKTEELTTTMRDRKKNAKYDDLP